MEILGLDGVSQVALPSYPEAEGVRSPGPRVKLGCPQKARRPASSGPVYLLTPARKPFLRAGASATLASTEAWLETPVLSYAKQQSPPSAL